MAAGRSLKSLIGRRRRAGDEGEDDEGPVMVEDSQSEGSVLSDADDDEASSLGGGPGPVEAGSAEAVTEGAVSGTKPAKKARKTRKKGKKNRDAAMTDSNQSLPQQQPGFKAMADTEAMMNGLRISGDAQAQETVDFESMGQHREVAPSRQQQPAANAPNGHSDVAGDRQRHDHEEYKRKRDSDPAFIPNRGNFFMHDTRGQQNGQPAPPVRGAWQGRGRGRGGAAAAAVGGPFSPANQMAQAERAAEQPWKHDLHDTINEEPAPAVSKPADSPQQHDQDGSARLFPKPFAPANPGQPRVISFSSTTLVGKVQIRVLLPGMKAPVTFSEVPWKHYTRLPNHRPPLRRDKPVRVSLPEHTQRYIFPSPDRSFIFIPRQMRPNQQGFHRGSYQRSSVGGYGYSSRRTSMYGGSVYASSVAASRRSSLAGISRADAFSPNSFASGMPPPNRPVVRLPHGAQHFSAVTTPSGPLSGQHTPIGMPQMHTYPLPQQPTYQGTPTSTVHQPRPQKAISVTGIESPALLQQASQSQSQPQEIQPFQNQLPAHMNEQPAYGQLPPPYYSPRQQYQYPQQPQSGTPLSGIPEQAIHAPSFQPPNMPYAQSPYYAPYPPQQNYYYSPPGPNGYPPMSIYMPPQGYGMMPPPAQLSQQPPADQNPSQPVEQQQPPEHEQAPQSQSQSGMVAHESNGMVFYIPASEAQQQEQSQNYQPAEGFVPSYAMPGLPPPTPAPETSAYYYPPMPPQMQGMYYPTQHAQQ